MLRALVDRAHGPGAVRLFLRLCRRSRRDGRAGLAGAAAAPDAEPRADAWRGGRRACRPPAARTARRVLRAAARRARASRPASRSSSSSPAACASASRRGSPSRRWPISASVDVAEIEEVWHGLAPPYVDAVRLAGGRGAESPHSAAPRAVPAGDAGPPGRGRRSRAASTRPTTPPNGNGTASASRPSREARRRAGSIRAPATTSPAPSPTSSRRMDFDGVLDGELLVGRPGGGDRHVRRPAAAAEPQDGDAEDAASSTRPSCAATTCLLRRRRGPARRCPSPSAARGSRPSSPTLDPTRIDLSPLAALRRLGRRSPRMRADPPASGDRGRDAQAARLPYLRGPPEGPVVQVEARPAHWSTRC